MKSRTKSRRSTSDKRRSFFGFSQPAEARRQTRRLHLESLEERRVLATYNFNDAAGTLAITLEANEDLTISEAGGTRTFAIDSGTFSPTGANNASTGDGTATITFDNTLNLTTSISVANTGAGAGTNNVTFAGGAIATATLIVNANQAGTTSAVDFSTAQTTFGTAGADSVSLTANGAGITDSTGSVNTQANAAQLSLSAAGQAIVLDNPANDFGNGVGANSITAGSLDIADSGAGGSIAFGTVNVAGSATINSVNSIFIDGAMNVGGNLVANAGGVITDSFGGTLAVTGTSALTADSVNLANANNFGGDVTVVSTGSATLNDINALSFGGASSVGSNLIVTAGGVITDSAGASIAVTGNANFSGTGITLDNAAAHNFGSLTFNVAVNNVTIIENSATVLTGSSTAGGLSLTSAGSITDDASADLAVTGNASLSGTSITLGDQAGNDVNFGNLTFNSAGAVVITEDSATSLAGGSTAASLVITSAGAITDGILANIAVTGNASLAGTSITIAAAATANFGSLTFNSAGAVNITEDSDTQIAGANTANSLVLTSAGAITDATGATVNVTTTAALSGTSISLTDNGGDSFVAGGNASFTASGGGAITIAAAGTANFGSLTFNGGTVSITEDSATALAGISSGGAITLNSAGAITDAENDAANEITGTDLILTAVGGIGTGANPIHIAVNNLDVSNTTSGGIFATDTAGGLTLTNLGGPNANAVNGVGGNGLIRAASPLTIAANAITSGGMTYTASDSAAAGDDLTVNAGVTVQDTTAALTMNGGDNVTFNTVSVVRAFTALSINGDALGGGVADPGVGSIMSLFGTIQSDTSGITITGNGDADAITIDNNGAAVGGTLDGVIVGGAQLFTINGNGGSDTLTLEDGGDLTGDTYTITATTISTGGGNLFNGAPGLNYANLETINIQNSNGPTNADGDTVTVTSLNAGTTYNVDGNNPTGLPGDRLILIPPGSINVYEIGGNYVFEFPGSGNLVATEFETIDLRPGDGILNIIGDEGQGQAGGANGGAGNDEQDKITIVGTGVGAGTLQLSHNAAPIAVPPLVNFSGVTRLNVNTFELADGLAVTPYANNTPQGWGIETYYNEGAPVLDGDLLIYNGVLGVSETIVVAPSAPEAGQVFSNNAATGTPIAVINYQLNVNIIVNGSSPAGTAGDTDTLTLRGTDPANPGTSGQDTFDADFTAAGVPGNELVIVTDSVGGSNLYSLQNFSNFNSINFAGLAGSDTFNVTPGAIQLSILGGNPIGVLQQPVGDILNVEVPGNTAFQFLPGPESDSGTFLVTGMQAVSFDEIELLQVNGANYVLPDRFDNPDLVFPPNNTLGTATVLGSETEITLTGLTLHNTGTGNFDIDQDFYQITAHTTGKLIVNAYFTDALGDVDIQVQDASGDIIAISQGIVDNEQIVIPVVGQQTYFLRVYSADGVANIYNLEIENFAAPTPTQPDLVDVSDTGMLNDDNVTADNTPTMQVTADLASFANMGIPVDGGAGTPGADVVITATSQTTGVVTTLDASRVQPANSNLWTGTFGVLADDEYVIEAWVRIEDGASPAAVGRSPIGAPLTITVDTTAPVPAPAPTLLASSDTLPLGDGITSIISPAFSGTGEPNAKVRIFAQRLDALGGVPVGAPLLVGQGVVNANGTWEITVEPLNDDNYEFTTVLEDAAGNISAPSAATPLTIAFQYGFYIDPLTGGVIFQGEDGVRDVVIVQLDAGGTNLIVDWSQPDALPVPRSGSSSFALTSIPSISIRLFGGNDELIVDSTNGAVPIPVQYDGGLDDDSLTLTGNTATSNTYSVGPNPGEGVSTMVIGGVTQTVTFSGLEPVIDNMAGPLVVNGTPADNAITFAGNVISSDNFETIAIANKTEVTINALAGSDTISINNPTGFTGPLNVNGGDPGASDTLIVSSDAGFDPLVLIPTAQGEGSVEHFGGVSPDVAYTGIEHVTLVGQLADGDAFGVDGTAGNDLFTYFQGETADIGRVIGTMDDSAFTLPQITFTGMAQASVIGFNVFGNQGGTDAFAFVGTVSNDDVTYANGRLESSISGLLFSSIAVGTAIDGGTTAFVQIEGGDGDDSFEITPEAGVEIYVNGGNPGASDTLVFNGTGGAITVDPANRTITEAGLGPVTYSGIESIEIDGAGAEITVLGSAGNDSFDVTSPVLDEVLVTVNGSGPQFHLLNGTYLFDGNGGTDHLALSGTAGNDTFASAPGAPNTATVNGTLVSFEETEVLKLIGLDGGDIFNLLPLVDVTTVVDAGGPNTLPGTTPDVLNVAVAQHVRYSQGENSQSGTLDGTGAGEIDFSGIEQITLSTTSGGVLTARGTDDNDTIAADRLGANDLVWINDGPVIGFVGFGTLTLQGRFGDDKFSITPDGMALTTINVEGGDPTASDEVVINGTAAVDTINYSPTAADAGTVQVNAAPVVNLATVEHLTINGLGGNDDLTLTTPAGSERVTYTPGALADQATIALRSLGFGADLLGLGFTNLGTGGSFTLADAGGLADDDLALRGRDTDDTFDVLASGSVQIVTDPAATLVTLSINTTSVRTLILQGLAGDDTFNIPGNHSIPNGIIVEGGDPSASDLLNFTGSGGAVTADLGASSVSETGFAAITYTGVETIDLDAGGVSPTIVATTGDDDLTVTVLSADTGRVVHGLAVQQNGQVSSQTAAPEILYSNLGGGLLNVDMAGGNDTLVVVGNALAQTFEVDASGTVDIDDIPNGVGNDGSIAFVNSESLSIFGLEGDDTFNVTAGPIPVFIDGGDPIGVQPGDVLNVIGAIGFFAGPESDEGGFLTGGGAVSFDHIESLIVSPNGPCPFLILGTNGDDDITVIARDDSYSPLADGVQDFTVSINAGPEILFIDEPELYIDARAGDDDIVIRTPAPNNAEWDVDVYVAGGPPSDGANNEGDRLVVETPGTQTVVYTPTGSDTGTIDIDTNNGGVLDSLITIGPFVFICDDPVGDPIEFTYTSSDGGVELLEYDGEDGDDILTIVGTDLADTIVHTPGETTDEGSLRVNNWLRLDYQNVGIGASLRVDGAGGFDTLVALGTSLSDTFDVEAGTGSVLLTNSLGSRIALQQANVEALTLEGLGGDDSFVLNATLPYEVVNVHGGEPGGSDSLSIVGAAAVDETFVVNPGNQPTNGEVLVDAVVNAYTGIEHLYLAGNAGDLDALTINDDLRDNLWTVSAGFVGDLVQIDGRESIDVSDFDTISLDNNSGSDRFEVFPTNLVSFATSLTINGDIAGPIDDVLAISGTAAADAVTAAGSAITTNGVTVTAGTNLAGVEVHGLAGDDDLNLTGFTAYSTTIFGGLGNDTIRGGNLADLIYGGEGNDILIGGLGNDILFGEAGNDRFGDTGTGNAVADDPGSDQYHGGDGSDTFVWDPGDGSDIIEGGGGGSDVLIFNGGGGADAFVLSANGTRLSATRQPGNILLDVADVEIVNLNGLAGADSFFINDLHATSVDVVNVDVGAADGAIDSVTVEGRNVSDNVNISPTATGIAVTGLRYNVNVNNSVAGNGDAFTFNGNNGNDTIVSPLDASLAAFFGATNFTLNGGLGDDYIVGYGNLNGDDGNDTLVGGSVGQTITGGDGDDLIFGGGGADNLFGNAGEDTFVPGFDNAVDSIDGGEDFDTILVQGTSANNRIDAIQDAIGQVRYNVSGVNGGTGIVGGAGTETDVVVPGTVEQLEIRAGSGDDIIRITQSDSLIVNRQEDFSLRFTVDGGQPGASDRLTVIDDGLGDTTIHRVGGVAGNGSYTIGALAPVLYYDIEFASLNPINPITGGTGADGLGTLFVFKHDPLEENNARTNATHLGANSAINVDPVIDPGPDADFGLPGDEDWYRVVAQHTGTLDFTIYFRQQGLLANGRAGLPGNGDLQLFAYDASGNLISGFGSNESAPTDQDERIRIPAVEGQTYFFRVVGNTDAINIYNITTVNTPAIVPFDLELDDIIAIGTVQAGSTATNVIGNGTLSSVNGFYTGKDISFTSGPLNGQRGRVINYIGATRTFVFAANTFTGAPGAGSTFQIESIDTGRSQLDNITRDNTPTIFLRVGDNVLLGDIPENGSAGEPGLPPDGIVIPIPFVPSTAVNANAPGFRVAIIHVENNTHSIVGYAQPIAGQPGVYSYTFTTPLADGSHFIAARVEMIDPTSGNPADTGRNQGLGAFSQSLEIVVDTVPPPVFFGLPNVAGDGLLPDSDSGVIPNQETADDLYTNDTTPGFFGQAEADAVIRLFIDAPQPGFPTGNGIFEPGIDFQVGFDVAEPFDGTNQYPQGYWQVDAININLDADIFSPLDGLRRFFVTAEDVAGNINPSGAQVVQELEIFLDTQGPQITDVTINVPSGDPADFYNLFDPKPSIDGPTPLVNSIWIEIRDLPARVLPDFDQPAFKADIASAVGHYLVRGDHNGIIPIHEVNVELDPVVNGQPATGRVQLVFRVPGADGVFNTADDIGKPLPDDRFTLTVSEDGIIDYAGNKLDGESNADEPHNSPPPAGYPDVLGVDGVPTGDTLPGGDFVARYTVDARPELGVWAAGSAWLDINGNNVFDPENPDFTNRDFTHVLGYTSDDLFSGKFMSVNNPADRNVLFDKLGAYGRVGTDRFRWLIDTDNDGVPDIEVAEPAGQGINGKPVAGNFAQGFAGDEVGVFTGTSWHLDTDHDFSVVDAGGSVVIPWSAPQGHGIVGDFDGDGLDDLASWSNDVFYFDLSSVGAGGPIPGNPGINGTIDRQFKFGFIGPGERPVAADMNQDGIEDVGLWVPAREGVTPREGSEWYFLVSGVVGNNTAGPGNPPLGANIGPSITGGNYPVAADGPGAYQTPGQYGVASYTNGRIVTDPLFPNAQIVRFEATPFGNDLYMQFGDEFALPLVGNFDPPVAGATGGTTTNPRDPHDVDNNGSVDIMDLLGVVNYLTANGPGAVPSGGITAPPYADVTVDGSVDILDLLAVVNYLVRQSNTPAEGEAADEVFGQMDAGSGTSEEDDELLDLLAAGK